jgi:hypothetical protein
MPEGTPGHVYRLRLAHLHFPPTAIPPHHGARTWKIRHR